MRLVSLNFLDRLYQRPTLPASAPSPPARCNRPTAEFDKTRLQSILDTIPISMQASRSLASTRCWPASDPPGTWPGCNHASGSATPPAPPPCCMRTKEEEEACAKRTLSKQKRERRSPRRPFGALYLGDSSSVQSLAHTWPDRCCNTTLSDTAPTVHREAFEAVLLTEPAGSSPIKGSQRTQNRLSTSKGQF